jgi:endonuclease YncB( thermonuclease family)
MRSRTGPRRAGRLLDILLAATLLGVIALIWARVDRVATRQFIGMAEATDGDSLRLAGERIRLRGIDAPELDQICSRGGADYPCGREARRVLADRVANASVACEGWQTDKYGRQLAVCRANGVDLNRLQVEDGWAVAYGAYEDVEAKARAAGRGLWAGEFDRPRDWRDAHGGMAEVEHGLPGAVVDWLRAMLSFP